MQGHQRALRGSERGVGDVDERNPHDVGERCTSTPHDQHESAQRGHAQQGTTQQVHTTLAWGAQACTAQTCTASACTAGTRNASMGGASAHNASMHSASTKHGPEHPRDVDDVDERRLHDLDERCTSAPHA